MPSRWQVVTVMMIYLYLDDIYDEIEIEEEISMSSTNATAAPGKKRRAADVKEAEGGTKRK